MELLKSCSFSGIINVLFWLGFLLKLLINLFMAPLYCSASPGSEASTKWLVPSCAELRSDRKGDSKTRSSAHVMVTGLLKDRAHAVLLLSLLFSAQGKMVHEAVFQREKLRSVVVFRG